MLSGWTEKDAAIEAAVSCAAPLSASLACRLHLAGTRKQRVCSWHAVPEHCANDRVGVLGLAAGCPVFRCHPALLDWRKLAMDGRPAVHPLGQSRRLLSASRLRCFNPAQRPVAVLESARLWRAAG